MEITQEYFNTQVSSIKSKGGVHLSAVFVLDNTSEVRFDAVEGKFDNVLSISDVEVVGFRKEVQPIEKTGDSTFKTTTYTEKTIIPLSNVSHLRFGYDVVKTQTAND